MSRFDSQRNGQGLIIFLHSTHSSVPIRPVIPRFQAVTKKKEVRNPAIVRYAGRDRASTGITRNCNYKPNYFRQIELSSKSDLTTHYSAFKDRTKPAGVCSELLRCDPFVLHLLLQRPKLKHRMSNKIIVRARGIPNQRSKETELERNSRSASNTVTSQYLAGAVTYETLLGRSRAYWHGFRIILILLGRLWAVSRQSRRLDKNPRQFGSPGPERES